MSDEVAWLDATAQAALVRSGAASPVELVDEAINRLEKLNGDLNAVVTPLFDEARTRAQSPDLPDGPFRGVPFLYKDIGACEAGMPQYQGNRALRDIDFRVPEDTPLAARLRAAGFIPLGKTNVPEFGLQATTQPLAFGATRNPWDLTRSTSGSSGGSAAAVAAGIVSVAHANDGGGSIRLPATWCGLVGLKPSRGRTPIHDEMAVHRDLCEHVVSRSVRDTAAILDAVHGARPWDLFHAPPPALPYVTEVGADPGRLRIGILTRSPFGDVHPDCVAATEDAGRLLESQGHAVEPSWPEQLFTPAPPSVGFNGLVGAKLVLRKLADTLGRPVTADDVEPYFWDMAHIEAAVEPADVLAGQAALHVHASGIQQWWTRGFDLLLTPTSPEPPARLSELEPPTDAPVTFGLRMQQLCGLTLPFNVTGQPAISVPLVWNEAGLPIGVQLVAAFGREDILIRVATQLESARPWAHRRPALFAS